MLVFIVLNSEFDLRLIGDCMDYVADLLHSEHAWLLKPLRLKVSYIRNIVSFKFCWEIEIEFVYCK